MCRQLFKALFWSDKLIDYAPFIACTAFLNSSKQRNKAAVPESSLHSSATSWEGILLLTCRHSHGKKPQTKAQAGEPSGRTGRPLCRSLKIWLRPFHTLKPSDDKNLAGQKTRSPTACAFFPSFQLLAYIKNNCALSPSFKRRSGTVFDIARRSSSRGVCLHWNS